MWASVYDWLSRFGDKTGSIGSIVAAMGCAMCFPAMASIGAFIGLGFLSQYEGLFLSTLLPVFATLALLANLMTARIHRRLGRALFSLAGPSMILATLYPLWNYGWSTYLFYVGLVFMLLTSIWDIVSPPRKSCRTPAS